MPISDSETIALLQHYKKMTTPELFSNMRFVQSILAQLRQLNVSFSGYLCGPELGSPKGIATSPKLSQNFCLLVGAQRRLRSELLWRGELYNTPTEWVTVSLETVFCKLDYIPYNEQLGELREFLSDPKNHHPEMEEILKVMTGEDFNGDELAIMVIPSLEPEDPSF